MRVANIGLLLFGLTVTVSAQTFPTPFLGQVIGIKDYPLALRVSPPNVSGGSYARGSFVCAAFPGTTFYATDRSQLATGETWYFVQIARPMPGTTACAPNVTGWMVGQLKDGRTAIAPLQPGATPPLGTAKGAAAQPQPASVKTVPTGGGLPSPFWTYPLLILGTFLAVVVLTWERNRRVSWQDPIKRLAVFEFVTLAVANVTSLLVLAPAYRQVEPNAWGAKMLQQLTGTSLGHILLGFILSIVIMKSVSFAAPTAGSAIADKSYTSASFRRRSRRPTYMPLSRKPAFVRGVRKLLGRGARGRSGQA